MGEIKKELPKFDKVIIKNIENKKMHMLLTNPNILAEAEQLNQKIENMFTYKPKKPLEEMSNREFRKYKRAKKRHDLGVPKNIDYKRIALFAICFFSIAIVGAIISWIYLATIKLEPTKIFMNNVEVFYNYENDSGESGSKLDPEMSLSKFENKKVNSSDIKKYITIKFIFKESFSELELKNMYFKLRTSGRGLCTYKINLYDAQKNQEKEIYSTDSFYFENKKDYTYKFSINYTFETVAAGSYIEFVLDEGKTQGLDGYMMYSLLFNKA